ncbi:protein phosphatase 2C domain-containing protein [Prevotella communis]|uniref:PP2C family serine/threonine-protein phosphatase n=2 Tax=Prevotella communis TaxID=2913614 RepID=UPI001EDC50B5|nr:PP2C family serine/threonine-protein phosphatase [Prevotella communis]UKK71256.1 protein phosphatase 2C domain-containing protein [Prevotella communis]
MRKHFLVIFSLLLCANNIWAQLNDSVLIDCYGAIRTDMVRTVCQFVGLKNDSVLNSISNSSLKAFKDAIAEQDTLITLMAVAKPLDGKDVLTYWKKMREMRRDFQYRLSIFFPQKEIQIEDTFRKYILQIDDLTKECNTFNEDTTSTLELYAKAYPSGRFSEIVSSTRKKVSSNNVKKQDGKTKENKSIEDNKNQNMGQGLLYTIKAFLITLFKWCIGLILTILLIVIVIRKWKIIVSYINKLYSMLMHNNVIIDAEDLQDEEKIDADSPLEAGKPSIEVVAEENRKESIQSEENGLQGADQETPPPPKPQPKKKSQPIDPKGKSTAVDADEWIIIGASVQGNGHVSMDLPCQDSHAYEYIRDGWGIAITSDGAGSAQLSHIGSAASVARAMVHFKDLIEKERWIENETLPSDIEWMKMSYQVLKTVRNELELLAKNNKCDIKDLSATIIVIIHSPIGLLSVHIGDGRAGYKDMNGEWHSLITPHKGEEANQTIFIPSDFWNIQFYEMSGVTVPESRIVREQVSAFTLMSDGCEGTSWLCNQYNESIGKYYDPNMPHRTFFDSLLETLQLFRKENTPFEERKEKWYNFIKEGNKSFKKETDDKTMILGALYM